MTMHPDGDLLVDSDRGRAQAAERVQEAQRSGAAILLHHLPDAHLL